MNDDTEHIALLLRLYDFLAQDDHIEIDAWQKRNQLLEPIDAYFEKRGFRVDYSDLAGIGLFLPKESKHY